jgi:hypothetical protein
MEFTRKSTMESTTQSPTKSHRILSIETLILSLAINLTLPLAALAGTGHTPCAHPETTRPAATPRPRIDEEISDLPGADLALDDVLGFEDDDVLGDLIAIDLLLDEAFDDYLPDTEQADAAPAADAPDPGSPIVSPFVHRSSSVTKCVHRLSLP